MKVLRIKVFKHIYFTHVESLDLKLEHLVHGMYVMRLSVVVFLRLNCQAALNITRSVF